MNTVNKQAGLSMVELLIALAISSFLILGVTQIYIDNKTSYLFQQGQAQNQENGRFSLMVLEQHLAKAGFRRRPDDSLEQAFAAGTFNTTTGAGTCTFRAGQAVTKVDDSTICLRFEPRDATEVDCAGTGVTTPADFATPYTTSSQEFVEKFSVNNNAELVCNDAVLADGVSQVLYTFGIGPASEREASSYTKTPGTSTIRSVRYSLLLTTDQNNLSQGMTSKAYCDWQTLMGNTDPCTPPDNNLYQIASSGIMLRNLMP